MSLLIDWNDPETPVRHQIWAILTQRPIEWREFIDYMWFRFRCRMQPGYENWVNVQEWELVHRNGDSIA